MSGPSSRSEGISQQGTGFARHTAVNLLGWFFTPAASFATGPILAHALSVDGRGELAAATMPLAVIVTVATIGLPEAVTYFIAQDRRRTKMLIRRGSVLILLPAAVATVVLFFASTWICGGNPAVRALIIISAAFVVPSLMLSIVRAVAAAHNRWVAITIERMITAATRLIPLVILFATGHLGLTAAALVTMISTLTGIIAYIPVFGLRTTDPAPEVVTNSEVLRYGGGIWLGSIAGILLMRIDQVLLSPLAGTFELGLYAVAVSISELPLIVNSAIRETAFTHLSSRETLAGEVGDLSRASTIIVAVLCLPVGVLAPVLIPPLFGSDFSASVPALLILLAAVLIGNPGSIAGAGLSSSGYPHLRSLSLVVACIVNIILIFLLAPLFGAIGAAIASLLGSIVSSNMNILWMCVKRNASWKEYYRFKSSDFDKLWRLLRRGVRSLTRRALFR